MTTTDIRGTWRDNIKVGEGINILYPSGRKVFVRVYSVGDCSVELYMPGVGAFECSKDHVQANGPGHLYVMRDDCIKPYQRHFPDAPANDQPSDLTDCQKRVCTKDTCDGPEAHMVVDQPCTHTEPSREHLTVCCTNGIECDACGQLTDIDPATIRPGTAVICTDCTETALDTLDRMFA